MSFRRFFAGVESTCARFDAVGEIQVLEFMRRGDRELEFAGTPKHSFRSEARQTPGCVDDEWLPGVERDLQWF